jgi:hypothetical protein
MLQTWLVDGSVYGAFATILNVGGRYRSGLAWVRVKLDADLASSSVSRQGYVGIDGNLHYPAIATTRSGGGVMAMSLSGANYYPSAAYIRFGTTGPTGSIQITGPGAGPLDDFCQYVFYNCAFPQPGARPRYGDYGAAVWDQGRLWIANEYVAQSCRIGKYKEDFTCGRSRAFLSNWSTHISLIRP